MKALTLCFAGITSVMLTSCLDDVSTSVPVWDSTGFSQDEYAVISDQWDMPQHFDSYGKKQIRDLGQPEPLTDARATLGRVLFYDTQLSSDNSVSCASCHHQELAFSDSEALSKGIHDQRTTRNSIALGAFRSFDDEYGGSSINSFSGKSLFWDNRAITIMDQLTETIGSEVEMGMQLDDIAERLRGQEAYEILFHKAFPVANPEESSIYGWSITEALSAFMLSMSADNTRFDESFDKILHGDLVGGPMNLSTSFENYTTAENHGKALFVKNCNSCHFESLSVFAQPNEPLDRFEQRFQTNNGLDLTYTDKGRGTVTNRPEDNGVFKIPSLRNIALTGPYMHDGRFKSLEEVIDFYSTDIAPHANLDERLMENGQPKRFNFTDDERADLIAFLHTLTDMSSLGASKYSDPWR